MSENKLVDKLVAGFNKVSQEMETRISGLDSEISKLNSEKQDAKDGLANIIPSIKKLEEMINHAGNYTDNQYQNARMLLDVAREGKCAAERKLVSVESSLSPLLKERDSLKKELENILAYPTEKKAEVYYEWLIGRLNFAKSEKEYTELANKFSDISGYKDCAKFAEECKTRVQEMQKEAERDRKIQVAIAELDKELNAKLKPLDDAIAELKKEDDAFWWVFYAGGILGIILALIAKGGVGYVILGGVVGLIIGIIIYGILSENSKRKCEQKSKEFENQKSALRSEYEKKKEEIRKNYQSL